MSLALQATARDAIITYSSNAFTVPVLITGTGVDNMLEIDDVNDAQLRVGTDQTLSYNLLPAKVTGRLYLQPLSVGAAVFRQVQAQKVNGLILPGKLMITSPSGQWNITFQNMIVTSAFKGFEGSTFVHDVTVHFEAQLPSSTVFGDLVAIGESIAGLAGSL